MMANDRQRLNIWLGLGNRFDFEEYAAACKAAGVEPQPALEFAQKAGMVSCAMAMYPDLPISDAYLKFIRDGQEDQPQQSRGVGDTVAKITHATGLDKLAELYTQVTGKPCGCAGRQDALNKLLPYGIKES